MANNNLGDIDYEILALFDDAAALSQMENILRNPEFYELLNIGQYQTPPPIKNDTERRTDQNKENDGFAVPKTYHCMYCEKQFYNQKVIRKHQLKHAREQLRCPKCRVNSYTSGTLRRHYMYRHNVKAKPTTSQLDVIVD